MKFRRAITAAVLTGALVVPCLATAPAASVAATTLDEYALLRDRWEASMTGGSSYDPTDPDVAARIEGITQTAQERWDSMDTSADRAHLWADAGNPQETSAHKTTSYTRVAEMAFAYAIHGSPLEGDAALRTDILDAVRWLYDHAYNESMTQSGNWWDWQIGVPQKLLDTLALMYDDFTAQQRATYLRPVEEFAQLGGKTGANRVWIAGVVGRTGAILGDGAKIATARDALSDVLPYVTSGDGFYEDGSFIQHGHVAYTGGYGVALLQDVADLVGWLDDTTWQVTDPQVANVVRWVYDGFEPLMYDGLMMDMARGREISRHYATDHIKGHAVISAVMQAAEFAPETDAEAFRAMVKSWVSSDTYRDYLEFAAIPDIVKARAILADPEITPRATPAQYQQYAAMDRAVQRRPNYAFGLSMSSTRIGTHESINDENLRGWYTGEGMTYLYNADLGQYTDDFWPTVDPYRLPGTTVDTQPRTDGAGNAFRSPEREAGGTELGRYGTSSMRLRAQGSTLTAKKSWFVFDDEIVALGAGITASSGRTIETTVENRKLRGSADQTLTVDGSAVASGPGWNAELSDVETIHLEGNVPRADLAYYFPGGATLQGLRQERTGAWRDIDGRETVPTDPVSASYLTLWYDHGVDPVREAYAYALLPGASTAELQAYAQAPQFTVLENSPTVQAVREESLGITAAQFWDAATVGGITSDARASVMAAVEDDGISVAVADPSQQNTGTITIELDQAATSALSLDPCVRVTQLSPTIRLEVDVADSRGATFHTRFSTAAPTAVPPAPTLHDAAVVDGELRLSWNVASQAAGYVVKYGSARGGYTTSVDVGPATSYLVPDVAWGETLYFTVSAYNALGSSPDADERSATPLFTGIVDNDDPDVTVIGDWGIGASDGFYGVDYLHDRNTGQGTKSVTYRIDVPPGVYRVSAWWVSHANRATAVPVGITHGGATDAVLVNQQVNGSRWNELGVFAFDGTESEQLVISNAGADGYVVADAIRLDQVADGAATSVNHRLTDAGGSRSVVSPVHDLDLTARRGPPAPLHAPRAHSVLPGS